MIGRTSIPGLEDCQFLANSSHRVRTLGALSQAPRDRRDLRDLTGASPQTMGRVLGDFTERRWIERSGQRYALTPLGAYVYEEFTRFREAMGTQASLRDVWEWLPREMDGFHIEMFTDAVISYPGPAYPYEPVDRLTEIIHGTQRLRGFGTTILKSVNNEAVCQAILDGLDFEYIYSPSALRATIAWDPERVMAASSRPNCTVFVHENLPDEERCGIGISDDRMGICCNDAETRQLRAIVDTADPAAREWAISVYESYRAEATAVDEELLATLSDVDIPA